jgi:hypothetical protein|tara:strand:+ start:239 stop:364 length:126 start_codon:yes stop_codon:yes gene_type:complete
MGSEIVESGLDNVNGTQDVKAMDSGQASTDQRMAMLAAGNK